MKQLHSNEVWILNSSISCYGFLWLVHILRGQNKHHHVIFSLKMTKFKSWVFWSFLLFESGWFWGFTNCIKILSGWWDPSFGIYFQCLQSYFLSIKLNGRKRKENRIAKSSQAKQVNWSKKFLENETVY